MSNGKGSKPRPFSIPLDKFSKNWNKIFGKKRDKRARNTK